MIMKIKVVLDFSAFACFIDKDLVWQLKLLLMKETMLMAMEVIDDWSLSLKFVMRKTKALEITIGSH